MKIPRDLTGVELIQRLTRFGYEFDRQKGSHVILTTCENGKHQVAIPKTLLKVGTLSDILQQIARHFNVTKDEVLRQLFE